MLFMSVYQERPVGQCVDPLANNVLGGWVIQLSGCCEIVMPVLLIKNPWFSRGLRCSGILHLIVHMRVHCKPLHKTFNFGEYLQDPPLLYNHPHDYSKNPHELFTFHFTHYRFHSVDDYSPEKLSRNRRAFSSTQFPDFCAKIC